MKIAEIFQSKLNEAKVNKPSPGATMLPTYTDNNQIRGSVKDWLKSMDIEPEHVQAALKKIKSTSLFKNQTKAVGLVYKEGTAEKNGTLEFLSVRDVSPMWTDGSGRQLAPKGKTTDAYLVYANGQIRWTNKSTGHMTPLKTPKPHLKANDPVGSLVSIYTAAIQEIIAKQEKHNRKHSKE